MLKKLSMIALLSLAASTVQAQTNVAVSIGQPGFYGQIILGDAYPMPQVVYPQPVIIQPPAVAIVQPPLYLRVPPGHMKKWNRYCGRYQACGRQVYFVQDGWYQNEYSPRYNAAPSRGDGRHDYHGRKGGRDHDHGHGGDRGKGGHGNGGGHGRD